MFGGSIRTYTFPGHLGPPGSVLASPAGLTEGRNELQWVTPSGGAPKIQFSPCDVCFSASPDVVSSVVNGRLYQNDELCSFVGTITSGAVALGSGTIRTNNAPFEGCAPAASCVFPLFVTDMNGSGYSCMGELDSEGNISIHPLAGAPFADEVEVYYVMPFSMSWIGVSK